MATYYIDPDGNNSYTATQAQNPATPWKTLYKAVTTVSGSGDIIHVNPGDYTESTQMYLDANVSIEGEGDTSHIISHYANDEYIECLIVLSGSGNTNQSISYIKLDGDNLTGWQGLGVYQRTNVHIHHCTFVNFYLSGVLFAGSGSGSNSFHDNTMTNCGGNVPANDDTGHHPNLLLAGQTGTLVYNNVITQTARASGSNGEGISGYQSNVNCKIYGNTITVQKPNNVTWTFSIELWDVTNLEIYNNVISGYIDIAGNTLNNGVSFHDNSVGWDSLHDDANDGLQFENRGIDKNIAIYNNSFKNCERAIWFCHYNSATAYVEDVSIYNNVIYNVGRSDAASGAGMFFQTGPDDLPTHYSRLKIWNNTVVSGTGTYPAIAGIYLPTGDDVSTISIRNNIIKGFTTASIYANQTLYGTIDTMSIENNLFYQNGNSNAPLYVHPTPTRVTYQNNVIGLDPSFISSTNFHLLSNSAAISEGIDVNLSTDKDGVTWNSPPSIGAYEYGGGAEPSTAIPTVTTSSISNIFTTSASCGGNVTHDGSANVTAKGVCWNTSANPTISNSHTHDGTGEGAFTSALSGLNSSTHYFVRAYATNSMGTGYGTDVSFNTLDVSICYGPEIILNGNFNSSSYWDVSHGTSISGGYAIVNSPNTYETQLWQNIDISYGNTYRVEFDVSNYSSGKIRWLFGSTSTYSTPNGIDYVANGHYTYDTSVDNNAAPLRITFYSWDTTPITLYLDNISVKKIVDCAFSVATVTTTAITDISTNAATSGGNVTHDGSAAVTAKGICWSTSENPTIGDSKTSDGTGEGSYVSYLTSLNASTHYHVRAYATNSVGTAYGIDVSFNTLQIGGTTSIPTVTTTSITDISTNTATSGGNVTHDGSANVTIKGVVWSTSENPTVINSSTSNGTGEGSYTSYLTGLNPSTHYHVRAYATNSVGTGYGIDVSFNTLLNSSLPIVTTSSVSNIFTTSASCGGNVTHDGSIAVTARGICWDTTSSPTVTDPSTINGTGEGSFTSALSGLNPSTHYFVRAYAINSLGISYGNEVTFDTLLNTSAPTVTTTAITDISTNTATGGGDVTHDGSANVTAKGICWSTSENPTITDSSTSNGTGEGSYVSYLTGLNSSTHYHVRAYATNSIGTGYGIDVSFNTLLNTSIPIVTTSSISNIFTTSASCGGNVTHDGSISVTDRGVCWNTSTDPTISNSHTHDGTGEGSFTSAISGLDVSTHYYVRAYATNSVGTGYGSNVQFDSSAVVDSSVYYVATDGSNNYPGTLAQPWRTWQYGVDNISPGDTLYIRGGTYYFTDNTRYAAVYVTDTDGLSNSYYNVFAYPGEIPIMDCSAHHNVSDIGVGLYFNTCSYWHFKGLYFTGGKQYAIGDIARGMHFQNCQNIIIENCVSYSLQGCGFTVGGGGSDGFIYFLNCDAYDLYDVLTNGNNADGYVIGATDLSTLSVTFENCRAWYVSDDGFDSWANAGVTTWINCWSFGNGRGSSGDGNAFKIGGGETTPSIGIPQRIFRNCIAAVNRWNGYDQNDSPFSMQLYNNIAYKNDNRGFQFGNDYPSEEVVIRNNISYDNSIVDCYVDHTGVIQDHNSWVGLYDISTSIADFISLDVSQLYASRKLNGNLPDVSIFHLTIGSYLIYAGINVSIIYDGEGNLWHSPPSIGAYEYTGEEPSTSIPTVTTTSITDISTNTVTGGGNVTHDGSTNVTIKGVVWSTSENPTITDSSTSNGTGEGSYVSYLTGLNSSTHYHIRAYATNSAGTGYGIDVSFNTLGMTVPDVSVSTRLVISGGRYVMSGINFVRF